jgi:hypothetical protein
LTPYAGTARLGLDAAGPGLRLSSTVATVPLRGVAGTEKALKIHLSTRQLRALRTAAAEACRKSLVLNVRLSGIPRGQGRPSVANTLVRVWIN